MCGRTYSQPGSMLQQEVGCGGGRCAASPSFSVLFPMPMGLPAGQCYCYPYHEEDGGSPYDAAGAPVDCTLSLGTPSTRRAEAAGVVHARAGGAGAGAAALMEEPRQEGSPPRRCANCDTMSTPLWRNGPRGPKSLCNACGIRYKKEERRAAADVAPAPAPATQDSGARQYACGGYARPPPTPPQWGCYGPAAGKSAASYGMYGGDVGVVDAAAAADGPCLSWMLNVVPSSPAFAVRERHTVFQYY